LRSQAILDINNGNTEAGLEFFKKDMAFWRRNLDGKIDLLGSMLAVARLTADAKAVSLLLSSPSIQIKKEQQQEWRALLTSLSPEQQSLHPVIDGEAKLVYKNAVANDRWKSYSEVSDQLYYFCSFGGSIKNCSAWQSWLEQNILTAFFKPNATFNSYAPQYKAWLKLTSLSWNDYLAQRDATLAPFNEPAKPGIDWIYNPSGKASRVLIPYDDYVGRLHDIDTYLRLIRLQLELRLAQIPSAQVAGFLKQLNVPYCTPCSDFSWDAPTHTLSFQPYNKQLAGRVPPWVHLPEPAAQVH
jgi:hypothetical protein